MIDVLDNILRRSFPNKSMRISSLNNERKLKNHSHILQLLTMEHKKVVELREIARSLRVKGYSKLRKQELIKLLAPLVYPSSPLPYLPREIWDLILRELDVKSLGRAVQTCRLWKSIGSPQYPRFLYRVSEYTPGICVYTYFWSISGVLEYCTEGPSSLDYFRSLLPAKWRSFPIDEIPDNHFQGIIRRLRRGSSFTWGCCIIHLNGLPKRDKYFDSGLEITCDRDEAIRKAFRDNLQHEWAQSRYHDPYTAEEYGVTNLVEELDRLDSLILSRIADDFRFGISVPAIAPR